VSDDGGVVGSLDQSAVVVPVPSVEPLVSGWRARHDPSAARGMPAHITAVYPFLPPSRLTPAVVTELGAICAEHGSLAVSFARTGRFPNVLYLDPDPADGLRSLTIRIADRWPEAPPYDGAHDQVVPHLTVALGDDTLLDRLEAEVRGVLPVVATLDQARLYVSDGGRWQSRARLPFSTRTPSRAR
jgi:2'-5' RNA ligase